MEPTAHPTLISWRKRVNSTYRWGESLEVMARRLGLPDRFQIRDSSWAAPTLDWCVHGSYDSDDDLQKFADRVKEIALILGPPHETKGYDQSFGPGVSISLSATWTFDVPEDRAKAFPSPYLDDLYIDKFEVVIRTIGARGCKIKPGSDAGKPKTYDEASAELHPECAHVLDTLTDLPGEEVSL